MKTGKLWSSVFAVCFLTVTVFGQSDGVISGMVKDSSGGAVPGATVTVQSDATGLTQKVVSNSEGIFISPQLLPGVYTIRIERAGFKSIEKTNVVLSTADKLNVGDFVLDVGQVFETVQIQADAGQLQIKTESGERSDLITNRQNRRVDLQQQCGWNRESLQQRDHLQQRSRSTHCRYDASARNFLRRI